MYLKAVTQVEQPPLKPIQLNAMMLLKKPLKAQQSIDPQKKTMQQPLQMVLLRLLL